MMKTSPTQPLQDASRRAPRQTPPKKPDGWGCPALMRLGWAIVA